MSSEVYPLTFFSGSGDRFYGGEGDEAFFVTDGGNNKRQACSEIPCKFESNRLLSG